MKNKDLKQEKEIRETVNSDFLETVDSLVERTVVEYCMSMRSLLLIRTNLFLAKSSRDSGRERIEPNTFLPRAVLPTQSMLPTTMSMAMPPLNNANTTNRMMIMRQV